MVQLVGISWLQLLKPDATNQGLIYEKRACISCIAKSEMLIKIETSVWVGGGHLEAIHFGSGDHCWSPGFLARVRAKAGFYF